MSRLVGSSLLLLALLGERCHLSGLLLTELSATKVLAIAKMSLSSTILA